MSEFDENKTPNNEPSENTEKKEEFLTVDEAAKLLHRDRSSLWRWSKTGYLTPVKIGAKILYRRSDIDKLLEGKE